MGLDYKEYLATDATDAVIDTTPTISSDILSKIKNTSTRDVITKSKYTVRGGLIGGIGGVIACMYYKKPWFFGAIVGGTIGVLAGNVYGNISIKK